MVAASSPSLSLARSRTLSFSFSPSVPDVNAFNRHHLQPTWIVSSNDVHKSQVHGEYACEAGHDFGSGAAKHETMHLCI